MKKGDGEQRPTRKIGRPPTRLPKAVSFLASDEASYVSGAELYGRWWRRTNLSAATRFSVVLEGNVKGPEQ